MTLWYQEKEYDFIVGDELLGLTGAYCPYSGIESYKARFFSEEMLDDWYTAFVLRQAWSDILLDDSPLYKDIRDALDDETVLGIRLTLRRIEAKCGRPFHI